MPTSAKRRALTATWAAGLAVSAGAAAGAPAFHPAQSAAERALERILKADEKPPGQIDPTDGAAGHRPRTTPPPGAPYLKYLTRPLATAILAAEAREVKANCGGVYKTGELCGMESDPVVCAQDFPDHYLFRTKEAGPNRVVIEAAWPPDHAGAAPSASGAYGLVLGGGVWKIDGVSCAGGDRYNWPPR